MSWADWWWRISEITRLGYREHRAANPWSVSLTTQWPRALLQCLFFTMIGRVFGGEDGQAYTFVGAVAIIVPLFTMGEVGDVPMRDRWNATFYRLRTSSVPIWLIYVGRAAPLLVEAAVVSMLCVVVVGVLTGQSALALDLLGVFPLYLVIVITSAATGLAMSSAGLFGRDGNDVIVANVGMYALIAASGALIEPGRVAWLDTLGSILPMSHGIRAIHQHLAGESWSREVVSELAVGAGWLVGAVLLYAILTRRVRWSDHDKVT